ncbi:MAG: hypothetical protein UH241_09940 [Acutalibacteraceae bacterium]|nr:hypothetical protein [Acutalibacteraceae bacterium]
MDSYRKIHIKVYCDGTLVPANNILGYTGEHNAVVLQFQLPAQLINSSFAYTLTFEDDNGNVNSAIVPSNTLMFSVPQELTECNTQKLQLLITNGENVILKSDIITMKIIASLDNSHQAENKYMGLLQDTALSFQSLLNQLGAKDLSNFKGVISIEKTNTQNLTDTYTVYYTDGSTSNFTINNGAKGDTYTITEQDKSAIAEIVYYQYISASNAKLENRLNGGETNG